MTSAAWSPEQFVQIWHRGGSLEEVVDKTGLAKSTVAARGYKFRKAGVPSRKLGRTRAELDYGALKKAAESN